MGPVHQRGPRLDEAVGGVVARAGASYDGPMWKIVPALSLVACGLEQDPAVVDPASALLGTWSGALEVEAGETLEVELEVGDHPYVSDDAFLLVENGWSVHEVLVTIEGWPVAAPGEIGLCTWATCASTLYALPDARMDDVAVVADLQCEWGGPLDGWIIPPVLVWGPFDDEIRAIDAEVALGGHCADLPHAGGRVRLELLPAG